MVAIVNSDVTISPELKFELEFARRLCECVGSPFAVGQYLHLTSGGVGPSVSQVEPRNYQEPKHFAADYQVAELLTKSQNLVGFDTEYRKAAALSKLLACEARNAETNRRLWLEKQPPWFGDFSYHFLRVLGPLGEGELNKISELGHFGPGAAVGVRTDGLVPSIKYEANPVCTASLAPLLAGITPAMVARYHADVAAEIKTVRGNAHFTVPKNYKIERCAAKEPLWNSYIQLGIGSFIAARLKRFGVDLHDQTRNQSLARRAYDENLATLDLSSASDLMAYNAVQLALTWNGDPQGLRWWHLLTCARSPEMKIEGSWRKLEMFSSMGNGFTFPLETAMFLAVCRTVVPRDEWPNMTVYGDDIIVPRSHASHVVECLEYLGFKVNSEKTCLAGTFFESCGTDWFKAQNVRPFYLHRDPTSGIPYELQAANALRAWCLRVFGELPKAYKPLWSWCRSRIPAAWRHPIPSWMGDVGLHVGRDEGIRLGVQKASASFPQFEGYLVQYAALTPVKTERKMWGVLMARLAQHGPSEAASMGFEPLRGIFGRVRTKRLVVLWEDNAQWGV